MSSILSKLNHSLSKQALDAAILKAFAVEQIPGKLLEKYETESKVSLKKEAGDIYVTNAGLILLHPFLPILFEQLKLTAKNEWTDEFAQNKAVLILDYLATGNDQVEEFNLMLNKILCGLDIDEVVRTDIPLNDEIKNECEALLQNVIIHWNALKNTGTNALRETFLQHYGKLTRVDNGWLLNVEQKATDILLGYLPWGFGIIRLPWMKGIIHTDWC